MAHVDEWCDDEEEEQFFRQRLRLPGAWLAEAQALWARYCRDDAGEGPRRRHPCCCWALVGRQPEGQGQATLQRFHHPAFRGRARPVLHFMGDPAEPTGGGPAASGACRPVCTPCNLHSCCCNGHPGLQAGWTNCWRRVTGRRRTPCCARLWRLAGCWRVRARRLCYNPAPCGQRPAQAIASRPCSPPASHVGNHLLGTPSSLLPPIQLHLPGSSPQQAMSGGCLMCCSSLRSMRRRLMRLAARAPGSLAAAPMPPSCGSK